MLKEVVGNYKILEKIGEGGMGEVFKAIDVMLEREVAIKVLRPELAGKSEIVARFRKEAVVLAKLNHPNIATLYNFVHHGDRYFMVMEFAHGRTLDVIIDRHPNGLPWRRSLELFLDALHAIEHAHNLDIVHRDVKPSNMMVNDRDILKVLDFGIARVLGSARLTRVGLLVGTLKYMSPEQIRGRDTDARSDIYSLGIVLYRMLSGRMPFAAESEFELMRAQIEARPSPLREIVPEVPRAVDDAVLQALAKSPSDRFQTAAEFVDSIGQALCENAGGFFGRAPPRSARTKSVQSKSAPVRPRLDFSGNLVRAPTEISGLIDRGRRGTDDESVPAKIDIAPEPLPAWKPPPPLGRRLVEAPVEPPPVRSPPYDAPRRKAQPIKSATPDPIIQSLLAVERELPAHPRGRRSARIAPQREDPRPTTPASLDETPTEHLALGRDPPRTAARSRAGVARWVSWLRDPRLAIVGFAILLAAGLTFAILNGAFSPPPDPLRIAWLMQRGEEALAAGKMSGPGGNTAETYAEEALQLAPEQGEARKLLADVVARLVEAGESSVKQGELPEAKLHWGEARRLSVKYAAGEEEVATLEKRIVAEEARRAAIVRQAEEQSKKRIAQQEQRHDELERQRQEQERQAEQKRAEDAALAARINGLLDQAGKAAIAKRWTTPAEDNVVSYAQQILAVSPQHAEARELIAKAARATAGRGQSALEAGDITAAKAVDASAAEKDGSSSDLDDLRAETRAALSANRLTTPVGDNAVEHADRMLRMPAGRKEAVQILRHIIGRYVALGEVALARGDIDKARGHQATAVRIVERYRLPDTEVRDLAKRLASPPEPPRKPIVAPVGSEPSVTEQEREIEKLPRELESMRREQAPSLTPVPKPAPGPTPARDQPVGVSPEPAGRAAAVEILAATPTQALARPGETIEFYTRFNLAPPLGRGGAYVEATWVLERDGRSLGQPGATSVFAKAGIGTLSTALTLPAGMAPGRYTVEHRIETENGEDSARSRFSVVSR
ncbi:MAG: protein kinase domain-containing protein [Gammaproteobacteria bacterium]